MPAFSTKDTFARVDLVEEIAAHGVSAVLEDDELVDALVRWLGGEQMSARADEPELRVEAAWEARELFDGIGLFDRLAAQAILALPPDHEGRDPALARRLLDDHLRATREAGDAEEELRTITALLESSSEDGEALLARGEAIADPEEDPGGAAGFEIAARSYCVRSHLAARDAGDAEAAERWMERASEFMPGAEGEDLAALASLAEELDIAQRWPEAADVYRRLVDAAGLDDSAVQQMAIREGELRVMIGEPDRAAATLSEALPYIEAGYLDALRDEDVAEAAEALASAVKCLAIAHGAAHEWSAVCRTLDRTRGLRLRQRAARPGLRDLERRLQAALRGAPDSPPPADLLEAYRRLRPDDALDLASPDGDTLARALDPGEAVAFVGHHFTGTVVGVAIAGPHVDGFTREDVATADWILALAGDDDEPGWIEMLADPAAATPGAGLQRLIDAADDAVGEELCELLDEHGIQRVTILAQDILTVIPWWALPSLDDLQVLAAGSAADLLREPLPPAPRTALIVSNPTLDLPVTAAACDSIRPFADTKALRGAEATEPAVLAALGGRTVLHFGGHGRSDVAYSALELHADPPLRSDPFPAWLAEVPSWRSPEDDDGELWTHRWADVPGRGRLHERQWLASGRLDRWLEHDTGTIAATYRDDVCVRVGELWSAADLLVGDALHDCRIAVLTACESAVSGRGEDSRALGLPAGLAFAGVGTVVGSLWPVDESLAALWTAAFYHAFAAAQGATIDVAALVHDACAHVRALSREQAAERLRELARTAAPIAAFMLEADAARLDDPPYAAPHHWAAFYVTGRATVSFTP